MNTTKDQIANGRKFYQIIMALAFGLNTRPCFKTYGHKLIYVSAANWLMLAVGPFMKFWNEKKTLSLGIELITYLMAGSMNSIILIILVLNRKSILSTYHLIQSTFIELSIKKGIDPDFVYKKSLEYINKTIAISLVVSLFIVFGPFIAALNDLGKYPLDDRSHWPLFWPKIIKIKDFSDFTLVYLLQIGPCMLLLVSLVGYNYGIFIFLLEITKQFEQLLIDIKHAFYYKNEDEFEKYFIKCIQHHQLIIKYLDLFKSFFKWVLLVEIITLQCIMPTTIYCVVKVEAPIGYKMKNVGIVVLYVIILGFHCFIGETVLSMHKHLAESIYQMPWYDMPNRSKQLIVIMLQRTQRDLTLNTALFSSKVVSRKLISEFIKQVYTILNVLLKF